MSVPSRGDSVESKTQKATDVLSRLKLREDARKAEAEKNKTLNREIASASESVEEFLAAWRKRQESLQADLGDINQQGKSNLEVTAKLDALASRISELELVFRSQQALSLTVFDLSQAFGTTNLVVPYYQPRGKRAVQDASKASFFLPVYNAEQLRNSALALKHQLEASKAASKPKKKFSFAKKAIQPANEASLLPLAPDDVDPCQAMQKGKSVKESSGSSQTCNEHQTAETGPPEMSQRIAKHLRNQVVVRQADDLFGGDFYMEGLHGCTVFLLGTCSALRARQLCECQIYTGPISGPAHFTGLQKCIVVVAAAQLRLHDSSQTEVYLRILSKPIIENCSNLRFAPYQLAYHDSTDALRDTVLAEENGLWKDVQDFSWLRAGAPSPNWAIMSLEDRVHHVIPDKLGQGSQGFHKSDEMLT